MSHRDQIEAAIRQTYAKRVVGDTDGVMAGFGPAPSFRIVGDDTFGELTAPVKGQDALRPFMQALIGNWDWTDFKIVSVVVEGNRAVVHSQGTIHHAPSGRKLQTETLDLMTVSDGKIDDFVQFVDTHLLARTLGLAA